MLVRRLSYLFLFSATLILLGVSASASEPDYERLIILAYETRAVCRLGEAGDPAVEAACATRDIYIKALRDGGYCFDVGEQIWARCD